MSQPVEHPTPGFCSSHDLMGGGMDGALCGAGGGVVLGLDPAWGWAHAQCRVFLGFFPSSSLSSSAPSPHSCAHMHGLSLSLSKRILKQNVISQDADLKTYIIVEFAFIKAGDTLFSFCFRHQHSSERCWPLFKTLGSSSQKYHGFLH